ncbi:unnamed protein product [marine sediment metagenome]|uniref:Uncharacterized protein n=1 Tax=marine sediment metagenome TaxID=412755 RepID=X0XNT4_9ZZZZ
MVIDKKDFKEKLLKSKNIIGFEFKKALKNKLQAGMIDPTGETNFKGRGVFRQFLKGSINYKIVDNEIQISMNDSGKHLEFGTPNPVTNFDDLKDWVQQKIFDNKDVPDSTLMRVTEDVKDHIERFGARPFPFIRHTINTELADIIKEGLVSGFKQRS